MSSTVRSALLALAASSAASASGCGAAHGINGGEVSLRPPAAAAALPATESGPPPAGANAAPIAVPAPGEWKTWSHEQKLAYMKSSFITAERTLFSTWEPVRYRDLECRTCHGTAGVSSGTFRMPNPDLPRIPPEPEAELSTHEPQVLDFMRSRVVPETARLLGLRAFDLESCYQCHMRL